MLSELLITAIVVGLAFIFLKKRKHYNNLPPGPKGWPIVGTLPKRGQTTTQFAEELRTKYGNIASVTTGNRLLVYIMQYDLVKAALAKPVFAGRPDLYTLRQFSKFSNRGISFSTGPQWDNARRFAMKHLKAHGMGKSVMESVIQFEAQSLIEDFGKSEGMPMEITKNINVAVLNVIWKLVADERYEVGNKDMQNLTSLAGEIFTIMRGPMLLLDWFPWLIHLPDFLKKAAFQTGKGSDVIDRLLDFLMTLIKKHQATLDPNNPRDYIDHYLLEMEAQKDNPNNMFTQDLLDLSITIMDMYIGGSESTSSTLRWLILYMAVYPEVQQKLQAEIDEVVPEQRLPDFQDKLPYLQAVIAELSRHVSTAPFTFPHFATEDTTCAGYTIPKDTIIMIFLRGCHYDPKMWKNPEEFLPERFLDSKGNFVDREGYAPFSTGRHQCIGESVARMELFLIGSTILKTFTISAPDGEILTTKPDETLDDSVINFAKPFKVVLRKRHQNE